MTFGDFNSLSRKLVNIFWMAFKLAVLHDYVGNKMATRCINVLKTIFARFMLQF